MPICKICSREIERVVPAHFSEYFFCEQCQCWQMVNTRLPSDEAERSRYNEHNNVYEDSRYREYLQHFIDIIVDYVPRTSSGIDVGAGENKVLCRMFNEQGYNVEAHDPLYGYEALLQDGRVDFIVSIETVEHFHEPIEMWKQMTSKLRPGGYLFVSTNLFSESIVFEEWWYIKDPTHVVFYSEKTMQSLAESCDLSYHQKGKMSVFQKLP